MCKNMSETLRNYMYTALAVTVLITLQQCIEWNIHVGTEFVSLFQEEVNQLN